MNFIQDFTKAESRAVFENMTDADESKEECSTITNNMWKFKIKYDWF